MPHTSNIPAHPYDLLVIGGGVNGCGIARDAAGRGVSVLLVEKDDLASATSSASTKLFHGGLRYLEYFEFRLVQEALKEREVLLRAMPHISWPMRFVLPYHKDQRFQSDTPLSRLLGLVLPWMKGRRPAWLIRLGLMLYDTLGGREILPGTTRLDLTSSPEGKPLNPKFEKAFEYSDCWVEDAKLVSLNARDAVQRGAEVWTRTEATAAERKDGLWHVTLRDTETGKERTVVARALVNAAGPWVARVIEGVTRSHTGEKLRLVRGSHIVVPKLYDHDKCYFFQGNDGRIIFAIPYETDFTLIGTTDRDHPDPATRPECSEDERDYLCASASEYFAKPVTKDQIRWTYSGVRPLFDDGASSASAATREYVLKLESDPQAPLLNVFGGKITTYRKLAEAVWHHLEPWFPEAGADWTAGVPLPGGEFAVSDVDALIGELQARFDFLSPEWAARLIRAYGSEAENVLTDATSATDLGRDFGATLTEAEVRWLMEHEFARRAEDVVWRRTKLGLRLSADEIAALDDWMIKARDGDPT